jgi:hypothetical protein
MPNARSSCLAVVPAYNEAGTIEGVLQLPFNLGIGGAVQAGFKPLLRGHD